jgi:hypothetical protein
MIEQGDLKKINDLYSKLKKNEEFEVMFNNFKDSNKLTLVNFMKVIKYIKYLDVNNDKFSLNESTTLDVIYSSEDMTNYRISLINEEYKRLIASFFNKENYEIFNLLIDEKEESQNITFMKKKKKSKVDLEDLDIRFRISSEKDIDIMEKLKSANNDKIKFRYKKRLTLKLSKYVSIDLTIITFSHSIEQLLKFQDSDKVYEAEIDFNNTKSKVSQKELDLMIDYTNKIKKVLIDNNKVITNTEKNMVLDEYQKLVGNMMMQKSLFAMNPFSIEIQQILENIVTNYSVTDKAEGDRNQLFIINDNLYLISMNLDVKNTNIKVKNLNKSIFDGELVYLPKQKKFMFLAFDCLFYKGQDIKNNPNLKERVSNIFKLCKELKVEYKEYEEFKEKFSMTKLKNYSEKKLNQHFDYLNSNLKNVKENSYLIFPKLFLYPLGTDNSEIYLLSNVIWDNYSKDKTKFPYELDGLIYTHLDQRYINLRKLQKHPIYKFKPPETNSIDVYVEFTKQDFFDNSLPDKIKNQNYKIVNMFVGKKIGNKEVPEPFLFNENNDKAFFPLDNGEIHDVNGNIVLDKTVIEVIYNNDPSIPHHYRWVILRTRWDKTESVKNFGRKYGNFNEVAIKNWISIKQNVTFDNIKQLSIPKNYKKEKQLLEQKIDERLLISERKQDLYYQKTTLLCKKMREFNNWLKSVLIYLYCSPIDKKKKTILDIGCGRGGDILKFFHSRVKSYVGIDVSYEGIHSKLDGAISRYMEFKGKFPDFPKMTFIQADASIPLNSENQTKMLLDMKDDNKKLLDKTFNDIQFDILNCQFAFHYLFKDEISIKNTLDNIDKYLKKDGYLILTLFDGNLVDKSFDPEGKINAFYTDEETGKRTKLFEIIKKYDKLDDTVGSPVDVFMNWINEEDKYYEEYLLTREFLEEKLSKINLKLVETDLFSNIYNLNRDFFKNVVPYEENPKNKKFYENVAKYYGDLKGADKESKKYCFLFRYYIFQKV